MRFSFPLAGVVPAALLYGVAFAAPASDSCNSVVPRTQSCNTPTDRSCWEPGYDINTDWEEKTPFTGVTRKYTFVITEVDNFMGPDGVIKKKAMLINNGFPGPTVKADWGDAIQVTVVNKLQTNGTGIHWHGIRQYHNNINDGTPGVTECPIPPGSNKTYSFYATQYGSSWYHTHVSSQYAYGVTGSIHIDGPASLPYDIDLGPFPISDWYYGSADEILARVSNASNSFVAGIPGASPPSDNLFFNGTNINPRGKGGEYAKVRLTPGKRHRLRLVNPSVDNTFTVSIVGHQMTVIETDFVPVKAYTADFLYMAVGQRYDVIIDASKQAGNYWINATFSSIPLCGISNNPFPAAILHYDGAPDTLPTDRGTKPQDTFCADNLDFVPIVSRSAPIQSFRPEEDNLQVALEVDQKVSRVFWTVNKTAIDIDWEKPTLQYVQERNDSFPRSENIVKIPGTSEWSFWLIQNLSPVPHPMHLHGHDFLIIGQSPAMENPLDPNAGPVEFNMIDPGRLHADNPVRRDATMLPAFGWLLIAFESNNPGAWLFHCHIAWHISQGLSAQFLEREDEIPNVMDLNNLNDNCKAWREYYPTDPFKQVDSGV